MSRSTFYFNNKCYCVVVGGPQIDFGGVNRSRGVAGQNQDSDQLVARLWVGTSSDRPRSVLSSHNEAAELLLRRTMPTGFPVMTRDTGTVRKGISRAIRSLDQVRTS